MNQEELIMEKLKQIVEMANGKNYDKTPTVGNALALFREIKKCERNVDELLEAKGDLERIFGLDKKGINKMTKNQLYMCHQSLMVNGIYEMLIKEKEN